MTVKLDIKYGYMFGRLKIIKEVEPVISHYQRYGKKVCMKRRKFLCECVGSETTPCGNQVVVYMSNLRSEQTRSCGCLNKERLAGNKYAIKKFSERVAHHYDTQQSKI